MPNSGEKFSEDALNIKLSNPNRFNARQTSEFKARLPLLEVIGFSFYMSWIFILYWGGSLAPATVFSDSESHTLRISMIAVVAAVYLLTGVFAKQLASKKGNMLLVVGVVLFAPANCYIFLAIESVPFLVAQILWMLTGVGHAIILILWSKHLVLFNRKQLILITACSFAVAGLIFMTISYLQFIPSIVATALLPAISLIVYVFSSSDAEERLEQLQKAPRLTPKQTRWQVYVYAFAYCIALGFMSACVGMIDYQEQSIVFLGIANILAGIVMVIFLTRRKRDIQQSIVIFLPCMALGIFLFAFADSVGKLICIAFLFFIFGCSDMLNTTTVSKLPMAFGTNFIRTFGFSRLPNQVGVLIGWVLGYVVFVQNNGNDTGIVFVSFVLVVAFAFVMTLLFEKRRTPEAPFGKSVPTQDQRVIEPASENPLQTTSDINDQDRVTVAAQKISEAYNLSARQAEVLRLLAKGRNSEYIKDRLFISMNTAKTHISAIYGKLEVHSQQELIDIVDEYLETGQ